MNERPRVHCRVIETQPPLEDSTAAACTRCATSTLTVEKGEFVFLTGPSGAGKSTLLRLLLLQERPSEGEIIVNGHNLSDLTRGEVQEYRRSIGFVFQDFKLIPTQTVFENVSFVLEVLGVPPTQQRRRTYQVLKWVGLQHRMNAYPQRALGRRAAARRDRARARQRPARSCWPTSRPAISIPICRSRS